MVKAQQIKENDSPHHSTGENPQNKRFNRKISEQYSTTKSPRTSISTAVDAKSAVIEPGSVYKVI
jgi:hypothetical protein